MKDISEESPTNGGGDGARKETGSLAAIKNTTRRSRGREPAGRKAEKTDEGLCGIC